MPAASYISAKEWQLRSFFEIEPTLADAGMGWPYNDFTFQNTIGDVEVQFAVAPADKDFTLVVKRNNLTEINLSALSIFDIRYIEADGLERLEILLTQHTRIELRLKPSFSITGWLAKRV